MNPCQNPYHKTQFAQKNPPLITGLFPRLFCKKSSKNAGNPFLALFEWRITDVTNLLLYGGIYSHLM